MTEERAEPKFPKPKSKPKSARAITAVRTSAAKAVDATSGTARDLARKTVAGIETNPVAVLASGVALGVLAGAFLPHGTREAKLLAPIGKRLADTARGAVDAARHSATSELDVLGLTRAAARGQAGKLIGNVVKALAAAGTAALVAAKTPPAPAPAPRPATARPTGKKADPEQ